MVGLAREGQSIARLASFICDYQLYELNVTRNYKLEDWQKDLKKGYSFILNN
jgi:hypothetical protein